MGCFLEHGPDHSMFGSHWRLATCKGDIRGLHQCEREKLPVCFLLPTQIDPMLAGVQALHS